MKRHIVANNRRNNLGDLKKKRRDVLSVCLLDHTYSLPEVLCGVAPVSVSQYGVPDLVEEGGMGEVALRCRPPPGTVNLLNGLPHEALLYVHRWKHTKN